MRDISNNQPRHHCDRVNWSLVQSWRCEDSLSDGRGDVLPPICGFGPIQHASRVDDS